MVIWRLTTLPAVSKAAWYPAPRSCPSRPVDDLSYFEIGRKGNQRRCRSTSRILDWRNSAKKQR